MTDTNDTVFQLTANIRRQWFLKSGRSCRHERFVVDPNTGDVECSDCGAPVSPAHALITIAQHHEMIADTLRRARDELAEIKRYAPHLRAAKRSESIWRSGHLPTCPHCRKGIEADSFGHQREWRQRKRKAT